MKIRKIIRLCLIGIMAFSLTACSKGNDIAKEESSIASSQTQSSQESYPPENIKPVVKVEPEEAVTYAEAHAEYFVKLDKGIIRKLTEENCNVDIYFEYLKNHKDGDNDGIDNRLLLSILKKSSYSLLSEKDYTFDLTLSYPDFISMICEFIKEEQTLKSAEEPKVALLEDIETAFNNNNISKNTDSSTYQVLTSEYGGNVSEFYAIEDTLLKDLKMLTEIYELIGLTDNKQADMVELPEKLKEKTSEYEGFLLMGKNSEANVEIGFLFLKDNKGKWHINNEVVFSKQNGEWVDKNFNAINEFYKTMS